MFVKASEISLVPTDPYNAPSSVTGTKISHSAPLMDHFRNGFLIVFLNPKIAAFFLAVFSQFLDAASSLESKLIMVITATVIDGFWYILLAVIIAVPKFTKFVKASAVNIEFFLGISLLVVSFVLGTKIINAGF